MDDAIAQVLRKYSDEVEGLQFGDDQSDDPDKPVQEDPPRILGSSDSQPWPRKDNAPVACMTSTFRTPGR